MTVVHVYLMLGPVRICKETVFPSAWKKAKKTQLHGNHRGVYNCSKNLQITVWESMYHRKKKSILFSLKTERSSRFNPVCNLYCRRIRAYKTNE